MKHLKIKVCGMKYPDNIKELIKLQPDFIGYIFYPKSPRFVGENPYIEIFNIVPPEINKVGVFVNAPIDKIMISANKFNLQYVQLHGNEEPSFCSKIQNAGIQVIKAFGVDEEFNFEQLINYQNVCDYFLFDTKSKNHGGTGQKYDWKILDNYQLNKPFFLSGGIGPDDAEVVKNLKLNNLYALDLNSKFETEPGVKDIKKLKNFIDQLLF